MDTTVLVLIALPLLLGGGLLVTLLALTRLMPGEAAGAGKAAAPAQAARVPARGPEYTALTARRRAGFRVGILVLGLLAILTVLEFFAANLGSTILMFLFMLFKGSAILYFFMHITSVWRTEEAH